jgi:hypothetical protein
LLETGVVLLKARRVDEPCDRFALLPFNAGFAAAAILGLKLPPSKVLALKRFLNPSAISAVR